MRHCCNIARDMSLDVYAGRVPAPVRWAVVSPVFAAAVTANGMLAAALIRMGHLGYWWGSAAAIIVGGTVTYYCGLIARYILQNDDERKDRTARSPKAGSRALQRLSHDPLSYVRISVAGNLTCPPEILGHLSEDNLWSVRIQVAGNPSCPAALLCQLLRDEASQVNEAALANPNLPKATLAMWQLAHQM
jgi:hypothetical protein